LSKTAAAIIEAQKEIMLGGRKKTEKARPFHRGGTKHGKQRTKTRGKCRHRRPGYVPEGMQRGGKVPGLERRGEFRSRKRVKNRPDRFSQQH